MKRITILTLLFLGFTYFYSYAQFDNYRLDQYINPDYKRQSLDLGFNTTGNFSSEKDKQTDSDERKVTERQLSGNFLFGYKKDQNSLSKQSEQNLSLDLQGNYFSRKNNGNTSKKDNFLKADFQFSDKSRYYFSNKNFIEFSPSVFGRISKNENELEGDTKSYAVNTYFKLGYGKGRIEHVEDARLAVYLLQDLQEKGVSVKNITHDMIDQLAQCMTAIKYKRHFDSRLKLIDEIATVDSFLLANDMIDQQYTSHYFTTLYDNWQYAGLITRLSGSRFSGGLAPDFYWTKMSFEERDNIYNSRASVGAYVNYTYEKPVNLYWQHSAFVELGESVARYRGMDENTWTTKLDGSLSLGYYPNSRTYMTLSLSEQFRYVDEDYGSNISSYTNLGFDMYYYLSPQLRLSANAGVYYNYNKTSFDSDDSKFTTNAPKLNFGATLTYSIF